MEQKNNSFKELAEKVMKPNAEGKCDTIAFLENGKVYFERRNWRMYDFWDITKPFFVDGDEYAARYFPSLDLQVIEHNGSLAILIPNDIWKKIGMDKFIEIKGIKKSNK